MRDCEMALHQDGRLVIRSSVLGLVYWNVSTVPGGEVVSWVLRLSSDDGSLSVTDIEDSSNVLWTNMHPKEARRTTTWIVVGVVVGVSILAMAGSVFYFYARTNILDPAEKAFYRRLEENRGRLPTRFTEARIKLATNNFENKIGSGGFGDLFYGKLPDGQEIAAKLLSVDSHHSKQEFYNEERGLQSIP